MKFGHLGFGVGDLAASSTFYQKALAPIGLLLIAFDEHSARFGAEGKTMLFIHTYKKPSIPFHFAFETENREGVDAFYAAALASGGKDNGAPGVRENYSPTYYAAFVLDPDGNNIEVVCR